MKRNHDSKRRKISLTRTEIVTTAVTILDSAGETGLTVQALAKTLSTGAGAIYWHVENRDDLLAAACDSVIAHALSNLTVALEPNAAIKDIGLSIFNAMAQHPWIGSAITKASAQLPIVRLVERLGEQIGKICIPEERRWSVVSALLSYILGAAGQNAANSQFAHANQLDRSIFLNATADNWMRLAPDAFPVTRGLAGAMREHDDREDFLVGLSFILNGMLSD